MHGQQNIKILNIRLIDRRLWLESLRHLVSVEGRQFQDFNQSVGAVILSVNFNHLVASNVN